VAFDYSVLSISQEDDATIRLYMALFFIPNATRQIRLDQKSFIEKRDLVRVYHGAGV
jgi:hypothetical protein